MRGLFRRMIRPFITIWGVGESVESAKTQTARFQRTLAKLQKGRLKDARRNGILDGERAIPKVDDSAVSQAEGRIKETYQADINLAQQHFSDMIQTYHANYSDAHTDLIPLQNRLKSEFHGYEAELDRRYEEEQKSYEDFKTKQQEHLATARQALREKERVWERECEVEGRNTLYVHLSRRVYSLLFSFLVVGEFPLNSLVFAIFRENRILTMIIAATIALGIPILAHFIGIWFKQHAFIDNAYKKAWSGTSIGVLGLASIAGVRYSYLLQATGEDTLLNSIAFFFINVLVLFIAMTASMFSHDENLRLESAYYELKKQERVYRRVEIEVGNNLKARELRLERLKEDNDRKLKARKELDDRKIQEHKDKLTTLMAIHDSILENLKGLENYIGSNYEQAIEEYRMHNRRARSDNKVPASWGAEDSRNILPVEFRFESFQEIDVTRPKPSRVQPSKTTASKGKVYPFSG